MNKQAIIGDFNHTFVALEDAIGLFNAEEFNEVPFKDSWTPAQVVQHVILANGNFAAVLRGTTKETTKAVDENIAKLKAIFLNFELKMKSPEFILPNAEHHGQEEQLNIIKGIKNDCIKAIEELDLTETCLDFELPTFGFLTRLEAIYFVIFHTQRHTRQLQEIAKFLNSSQTHHS